MDQFKRVRLEGYKSIKKLDLPLARINVLIRANGAGKSNFISLFKMVNYLTTGFLQGSIGSAGGANALLHYGARETPQMRIKLDFETGSGRSGYFCRLMDASPDKLMFASNWHHSSDPLIIQLGSGHLESSLEVVR